MPETFPLRRPEQLFRIAQKSFAKRDFSRSFNYLLRAVDQDHSMREAHFWLGWGYYLGWHDSGSNPDLESATNAFLISAQQDYTFAQNNLAVLWEDALQAGRGGYIEHPSLDETEHWFHLAAQRGLPRAQYNLGRIYQSYASDYPQSDAASKQHDHSQAEYWYR
jgi:TPR repeat protein